MDVRRLLIWVVRGRICSTRRKTSGTTEFKGVTVLDWLSMANPVGRRHCKALREWYSMKSYRRRVKGIRLEWWEFEKQHSSPIDRQFWPALVCNEIGLFPRPKFNDSLSFDSPKSSVGCYISSQRLLFRHDISCRTIQTKAVEITIKLTFSIYSLYLTIMFLKLSMILMTKSLANFKFIVEVL